MGILDAQCWARDLEDRGRAQRRKEEPIPKRGNQKAEDAIVDVRFSKVELTPPKEKDYPPIKVWAVYILEAEGEDVDSPIEWMLLTKAEVNSFKDVRQRVE